LGCGRLAVDEGHLYNIPLPTSLNGQAIWKRVIITLAWLTPINCRNRKYRKGALYFDFPSEDIEKTLKASRQGADWTAVKRGTVQHEIFESEYAAVYREEKYCRYESIVVKMQENWMRRRKYHTLLQLP